MQRQKLITKREPCENCMLEAALLPCGSNEMNPLPSITKHHLVREQQTGYLYCHHRIKKTSYQNCESIDRLHCHCHQKQQRCLHSHQLLHQQHQKHHQHHCNCHVRLQYVTDATARAIPRLATEVLLLSYAIWYSVLYLDKQSKTFCRNQFSTTC